MNIHVTANEAGRNACYLDKLEKAIRMLVEAIEKKQATKKEIIQCLFLILRYSTKTLKVRPTIY